MGFEEGCKVSNNILKILVYLEKIPERGEDAEPISEYYENSKSGLISVFDGLGGAGSAVYEEKENSSHTGAYFASRLAKEIVCEYFKSRLQTESTKNQENTTWRDLEVELGEKFKKRAVELDKNPSKIKSPLINRLPTTMAAIYFRENTEYPKEYTCYPIWAGDSRCYILKPSDGLQQITQDELKSQGDAFENLLNDSPLSNYINADIEFSLQSRKLEVEIPCVLLVATDGCFSYFPTPIHFEDLLLSTLHAAEDKKRWKENLEDKLEGIAGDDVSMVIVAIGWDDNFKALKRDFKNRYNGIKKKYFDRLDELNQKINECNLEIDNLTQKNEDHIRERKDLHKKFWEEYKSTYDRTRRGSGEEVL